MYHCSSLCSFYKLDKTYTQNEISDHNENYIKFQSVLCILNIEKLAYPVHAVWPSSRLQPRWHLWKKQDTRPQLPVDTISIGVLRVISIPTTPVIPLPKVRHQSRPFTLPWAPWAAVPIVAPITIRRVVTIRAALRPILSQIRPTKICPMIAPDEMNTTSIRKTKELPTYKESVRYTGRNWRRIILWIDLF